MPDVIKIFFYFMGVLALIGVCTWLFRQFNAKRIGSSAGSGRIPRLAVISATEVDNRRRLVLVRRDNVEHLLMIGGPTDIVVEANILRTAPVGRDNAGARAPASDPSWLDNEPTELREPAPMPEPRPSRPSLAGDEPRRGAPPPMPAPPTPMPMPMPERRPEPRSEPMTGFAQDAMNRPPPPMRPAPKPMPRPAAAPPVAPPVAPSVAPSVAAPAGEPVSHADQNLAEMAQRLEAALRRPGAEPGPHGPQVAVSPVDRIGAPPVAPEAAPARKAPPVEPPAAGEPAPKIEKTGFESLEAEMASLLGRPKNPS